jgi:hypothetical protein
MDLALSRQEIRRLCRSVIGDATDELISSDQNEQINALIDSAANAVASKCRWLALQRRAEVGLDENQELLSYTAIETAYWLEQHYPTQYLPLTYGTAADNFNPADLASANLAYIGPGNITNAAIWSQEARRYYPVRRITIPIEQDQDRYAKNVQEQVKLDTLAGKSPADIAADVASETALSKAQRGQQVACEPRADGIHWWPIPEERRVCRIAYTVNPGWQCHMGVLPIAQIDQIPSNVDGLAIQFRVLSDMYAQQGDSFQSKRYCDDDNQKGQFWDRIRQLRAAQATGEAIPLDSSCTFDDDRDLPERTIPRWNLRPIYRGNVP